MNSIILFTFLTLNLDEQRKFVLKKLNEFGIVKSSLTETITQHVKLLVKSMRNESSDGLVHLEQIISVSTLRSIWNIVTSSKLDLDDPLVHHIYQGIDKIINSSRLASVFMVIWARHIINLDGVREMMMKIVDDNIMATTGSNSDLVDVYLYTIEERGGRTYLKVNVVELFGAWLRFLRLLRRLLLWFREMFNHTCHNKDVHRKA